MRGNLMMSPAYMTEEDGPIFGFLNRGFGVRKVSPVSFHWN